MHSKNTSEPTPTTFAAQVLCQDNLASLEQLQCVIEQLSEIDYQASSPPCDSGIGCHVRHILDHYDAFLAGLETGTINYDQRARDGATESRREVALQRISDIENALTTITAAKLTASIDVIMDCGSEQSARLAAPSTALRELQFLVSHTVHHDALIAASVSALGYQTQDGFGIAPSTLRHADCSG